MLSGSIETGDRRWRDQGDPWPPAPTGGTDARCATGLADVDSSAEYERARAAIVERLEGVAFQVNYGRNLDAHIAADLAVRALVDAGFDMSRPPADR
jgi:hypothetical protein